jgi:hypothetical protein
VPRQGPSPSPLVVRRVTASRSLSCSRRTSRR